MQGAREYAEMFSSGQHGRLYLRVGHHARGRVFHIYVLPDGESANGGTNHSGQNAPLNKDAVEVYGITGGQPGWTETYGWLHRGKWELDFADLVRARLAEIATERAEKEAKMKADSAAAAKRNSDLLASY